MLEIAVPNGRPFIRVSLKTVITVPGSRELSLRKCASEEYQDTGLYTGTRVVSTNHELDLSQRIDTVRLREASQETLRASGHKRIR